MNNKKFRKNVRGANKSNDRRSITVTLSSETLDLIESIHMLDGVFDKVCCTLADVYDSDQALMRLEDGFIKKHVALRNLIEGYMMDAVAGDLYEGGVL
jgi:hypothetical protein